MEGVSNKIRVVNHITEIVFPSFWGNFVLYETALLLLFLFRCSWMRVNVSIYERAEPMPIAPHSERSRWMLRCFPSLMSVLMSV